MRRPARVVIAAALAAAVITVAGCGGGSLEASTDPVAEGTELSPRRYLADAAASAAAIRDFSAQLEEIGPVARPAALRELAPQLAVSLAAADTALGRLEAARLADTRLEAQRAASVPLLQDVVDTMAAVTRHAAAGEPEPTVDAVQDFTAAVEALRELPVAGTGTAP